MFLQMGDKMKYILFVCTMLCLYAQNDSPELSPSFPKYSHRFILELEELHSDEVPINLVFDEHFNSITCHIKWQGSGCLELQRVTNRSFFELKEQRKLEKLQEQQNSNQITVAYTAKNYRFSLRLIAKSDIVSNICVEISSQNQPQKIKIQWPLGLKKTKLLRKKKTISLQNKIQLSYIPSYFYSKYPKGAIAKEKVEHTKEVEEKSYWTMEIEDFTKEQTQDLFEVEIRS